MNTMTRRKDSNIIEFKPKTKQESLLKMLQRVSKNILTKIDQLTLIVENKNSSIVDIYQAKLDILEQKHKLGVALLLFEQMTLHRPNEIQDSTPNKNRVA